MSMKTAVIFYSLEGNTAYIAKIIAENLGADLIELKPKKEFPTEGFKKFFWGGKSVIFKEKPQLEGEPVNIDNYDTLVLGTPVWAGNFAAPMYTFLSENKIDNKKILLFVCHEGGGAERCLNRFKKMLAGNQILGETDFQYAKKMDAPKLKEQLNSFCELTK